jgi:carbamate kinase
MLVVAALGGNALLRRGESADADTQRPKIEAACRFASQTGKIAAIGALADAPAILTGRAGTRIVSGRASSPGRAQADAPRRT